LIHSNSTDPVLIKRISLKIWSLRDEVEAVLTKALRDQPDKKELSPEEIKKIKSEYEYRGPIDQRPNLQLVQGGAEGDAGEGEDLEAAMAAAMGGGDEAAQEDAQAEEGAEASAESEESGEDLEAAMAEAMGGGSDAQATPAQASTGGPLKVVQRSSDNIPESKVSRGVTILSEVSMDSLYFFGSQNFLEGQSIVIEFQVPKRFVVNATVAYCRPFNIRSRIISDKKVSYRVVARFSFLKDGERTLLRDFIKSIEPEVPVAPAKPAQAEADDGDDDGFDGLDGLDL
jgi:hypothetical protein